MGKHRKDYEEEYDDEVSQPQNHSQIFYGLEAIWTTFVLPLPRLCRYAGSLKPRSPLINLIIDSLVLIFVLGVFGTFHFLKGIEVVAGILGLAILIGFMRRHRISQPEIPKPKAWDEFGERLKTAYSAKFGGKNQAFDDEIDVHIRAIQSMGNGQTKKIDKDWLKRMAIFVEVPWAIPDEENLSENQKTQTFHTAPDVKFETVALPKKTKSPKKAKKQKTETEDEMPSFDNPDVEEWGKYIKDHSDEIRIKGK